MRHLTRLQNPLFMSACILWTVLLSEPAFATTCDVRAIKNRSIETSAKVILENSDLVGLGVVRKAATKAAVQQQEVQILVPIKGSKSVVRLSPLRVEGVRNIDGAIRWFYFNPDDIRLFALRKTGDGYVTQTCLAASLNVKPQAQLFLALSREAN